MKEYLVVLLLAFVVVEVDSANETCASLVTLAQNMQRTDCGRQSNLTYYTKARCEHDTRCCWDTSYEPYCFFKPSLRPTDLCDINAGRVECGYFGIPPPTCIARGCCYTNQLKGIACYKPKVDGVWGDWKTSECAVTCRLSGVDAYAVRTRICSNPAPAYGGTDCVGNSTDKIACNPVPPLCPIDGQWSAWVTGSCNATCQNPDESLYANRTRTCTKPAPANNGSDCIGTSSEKITCTPIPPLCQRDGQWSSWTTSDCDVTCRQSGVDAHAVRTRQCNNPTPANGGATCLGISSETLFCSPIPPLCPIDGQWSNWQTSPCNVSCLMPGTTGSAVRTRSCNNPAPSYGGADCVGNETDSIPCNPIPPSCPIDGQWSNWTVSSCDSTCTASGVVAHAVRTRTCNNPAPAYGGSSCAGTSSDIIVCNPAPPNCTIDGQWSEWTVPACAVTCTAPGVDATTVRNRECNDPAPQFGGEDCYGNSSETVLCSPVPPPCPIDGLWSDWTISACDSTCTLPNVSAYAVRTRTCNEPAPQYGGNDCAGSMSDMILCSPTPPICSVDGSWSEWTTSDCDVTCRTVGVDAKVVRTRQCSNPTPAYGGADCVGSASETIACNPVPPMCAIDGQWSDWTTSGCSVLCRQDGVNANAVRTRECNNPIPIYGGADCKGNSSELISCDPVPPMCPIDGDWSDWTDSACSVTCRSPGVDGVVTRTRVCNNPAPAYAGADCVGSNSATVPCNPIPSLCPIDGQWSAWNTSSCEVTCRALGETANAVRTRTCDSPAPANGGADCIGTSSDMIYCNPIPPLCAIDGQWSDWMTSSCDVTCGDGHAVRTRQCNYPSPANGGADCVGSDTDRVVCHAVPSLCPVDGSWSAWSATICDVTCRLAGEGAQATRTRECNNPEPANGGANCVGNSTSVVYCDPIPPMCKIDGQWSSWTTSRCDVTCGDGHVTRIRQCTNPAPSYGGEDCQENNTEAVACDPVPPPCDDNKGRNESSVPIDGNWSEWNTSSCDVTCTTLGLPTHTARTRQCNNPAPQNGGKNCEGSCSDVIDCMPAPPLCSTDGQWGGWAVSACEVTCRTPGVDARAVRSRECNSPPPANGGADCKGSSSEMVFCSPLPPMCPIDGGWSDWTCTRTCTNPAPHTGGKTCAGKDVVVVSQLGGGNGMKGC